jgi:hypothetical protein
MMVVGSIQSLQIAPQQEGAEVCARTGVSEQPLDWFN